MPKRVTVQIKLPEEQPDRCIDCPLLGIIPLEKRRHGSKKTYLCIPDHKALAKRKTSIRKSDTTRSKPLKRPCDNKWHAWVELPKRMLGIRISDYNEYRLPLINSLQLEIDFDD